MAVLGSREEGDAGEGCACRAKDTQGAREPQPVPGKPEGKASGGAVSSPGCCWGCLGQEPPPPHLTFPLSVGTEGGMGI